MSPSAEKLDLINYPGMLLVSQTGLASLPSNVITAQELVSAEGDYVSNRRRSSRQIVLSYKILGDDAKATRRLFARRLNQYAQGRLIYKDSELDVYIPVDVEDCEIDPMTRPVTLTVTFRANYPYFMSNYPVTDSNITATKQWTFPFTYPVTFGTFQMGNAVTVENDSDIDMPFVWRVTAREANSSNKLEFAGNRLEFTTAFQVGETLEVDTRTRTAYRIDAQGTKHNALPDLVVGSRFFSLPPGIQTLTYTGSGLCNIEGQTLYKGV